MRRPRSGLQLLRRTFTPESINPLWLHAIHNEGSMARQCPSCGNAMIEVALDSSSGIRIEVCRLCEFVWFDAGETQPLQVRPAPKPLPPPLPQELGETIALAPVQQLAAQAHCSDFDSAPPEEWWKSIAAFWLAIRMMNFGSRDLAHTAGWVRQKFGCNLVPTLYFPSRFAGEPSICAPDPANRRSHQRTRSCRSLYNKNSAL